HEALTARCEGTAQVDLSSLAVRLELAMSGTSLSLEGSCATPEPASGAADCANDGASLLDWFSSLEDVGATVKVAFEYGSGGDAAESEAMEVVLARTPVYTALSGAGVVLTMPMGPRLQGEHFVSKATANTGGYALEAFTLELKYTVGVLAYVSYTSSSLYNAPVVNGDPDAGTVTYLVTGSLDQATAASITGDAVELAQFTFSVSSAAAPGTTSGVMSCVVTEMVNAGSFTFLRDTAAQVNGALDGAQTAAQLTVEEPTVVGVFAYAASAELCNTAHLDQSSTATSITSMAVYSSGSDQVLQFGWSDLSYSFTDNSTSNSVATLGSGSLEVGSQHGAGAAALHVSVKHAVHAATLKFRVWFPTLVNLTAAHATLAQIQDAQDPAACGSALYQTAQLAAIVHFGGADLPDIPVDGSCLVALASNDSTVAEVEGRLVHGRGDGVALVSPSTSSSDIPTIDVVMTVSSTATVTVEELVGELITGAVWDTAGVTTVDLDPASSLSLKATLQQVLSAEGQRGPVFFWARLSDDTWQTLLPQDGLNVSVAAGYERQLGVAQERGLMVGEVMAGAEWALGPMLTGVWQDQCSGAVLATGSANVLLDMAAPVSVTLTADNARIARPEDAAADAPVSIPTSAVLKVTLHFDDGTTRDMSADSRTNLTVLSGSHLATLGGAGYTLSSASGATGHGGVEVLATFVDYAAAVDLSARVQVTLVQLDGLQLAARPYPAFAGSADVATTVLRQVHCSGQYQRASSEVSAVLSDGSAYDVTSEAQVASSDAAVVEVGPSLLVPVSPGACELLASWNSHSSEVVNMTVTPAPARVTQLEHATVWGSQGTFVGVTGSQQRLAVTATFDDGTQFPDALNEEAIPSSWLTPSMYLAFDSSEPEAVNVNEEGVATLVGNHHSGVILTVSSTCADGTVDDSAAANDTLYANLEPELGDVDLGMQHGLQLPAVSAGESFDVAVRVNSASAYLLSFQVVIRLDAALLTATTCNAGSDWAEYGLFCTIGDPAEEVLLLGSQATSTVQGAAISIATVTFAAAVPSDASVLTSLVGDIEVMIRADSADDDKGNATMVAGAGDLLIFGSNKRRRSMLTRTEHYRNPKNIRSMAAAARWHGAARRALEECEVRGDANADCAFDVSDVLFVQRHLARFDGYTDLSGLGAFQRQQMDPTMDHLRADSDRAALGCTPSEYGAPCPTAADALYLLRARQKYYPFLQVPPGGVSAVAAVDEGANGTRLVLTVSVVDQSGEAPAAEQVEVRLEVSTQLNLNMSFVVGEDVSPTSDGLVVTAVSIGNGAYEAVAMGAGDCGSFVAEGMGVAVLVKTFDSSGASGTERQFPFFGSTADPYGAQGYTFDALTSVLLPVTYCSPPPSPPPVPNPPPESLTTLPAAAMSSALPLPPPTPAMWMMEDWSSCSIVCDSGTGAGTQTRNVWCANARDESECPGDRPADTQPCNYLACEIFRATPSAWGECEDVCAPSQQRRAVTCQGSYTGLAEHDQCDAQELAAVGLWETCGNQACEAVRWEVGVWGRCDVTCGGGSARRSVTCEIQGQATSGCVEAEKPEEVRGCNQHPCEPANWAVGAWGGCSEEGGDGVSLQERDVTCMLADGTVAADPSVCSNTMPAVVAVCGKEAGCNAQQAGAEAAADCNGRGACVSGECSCSDGYTGALCQVAPGCTGVATAHGDCCAGTVNFAGECCGGANSTTDAAGACCASGVLDACGVCDGEGAYIDILGECCAVLDAGGLCCGSGYVDDCGVCEGDGMDCVQEPVDVLQARGGGG
ncbi:hypothetical protein CYMTET_28078, partial [Cymbomonas tetramitiformis]